jgi:hypothetical protein
MAKKRIDVSNRLSYTIIAVVALILVSAGVYALTAGTAPNPGHTLDNVASPSSCSDNTFLKWTGTGWSCKTISLNDLSLPTLCSTGQHLAWISDQSGWGCVPIHFNSNVYPPSPCVMGQVLQWTGSSWKCVDFDPYWGISNLSLLGSLRLNNKVELSFYDPTPNTEDIHVEAKGWQCQWPSRDAVCSKMCFNEIGVYTGGEYVRSTTGGECGIFYCDCWVLKQDKVP